jgi:hypothetical protein
VLADNLVWPHPDVYNAVDANRAKETP